MARRRSAWRLFRAWVARTAAAGHAAFALLCVGLTHEACARVEASAATDLVRRLRRRLLAAARWYDPSSRAARLFPGHTFFFLFLTPQAAEQLWPRIREIALGVCTDAPSSDPPLRPSELHVSRQVVQVPLEDPLPVAFNAVVQRLLSERSRTTWDHRPRLPLPDDLTVALQPIVSLTDRRIIGHEVLIREWAGPGHDTAAPIFRQANAHGALDILEDVCRSVIVRALPSVPLDGLLFVNIRPRRNPRPFLDAICRAGVPASRVVLEVSERTVFRDQGRMARALDGCRRAGARLALDDVGVGHTGLGVLASFRWDYLKLDRSLITQAEHSGQHRALLTCLVEYAACVDAQVIAEGIETLEQMRVCQEAGVRFGQGFLLGRPMHVC